MAVQSREKLFNHGSGGFGHDLHCQHVPALPLREEIHFSCGPLGTPIPGLQSIVHREVARWTLLLQEYEFDIVHRPGAQNAVADYLSRLESGEAPEGVKDDFPDGGVLKITTEPREEEDVDKWMVDMEFFLSNGIPPEEMGREERKQLGV